MENNNKTKPKLLWLKELMLAIITSAVITVCVFFILIAIVLIFTWGRELSDIIGMSIYVIRFIEILFLLFIILAMNIKKYFWTGVFPDVEKYYKS